MGDRRPPSQILKTEGYRSAAINNRPKIKIIRTLPSIVYTQQPQLPRTLYMDRWGIYLYDTSQNCRLLYAFYSFVYFLTVYVCFKKLLFFLFLTPPLAMFAKLINKKIMILIKNQNVFRFHFRI